MVFLAPRIDFTSSFRKMPVSSRAKARQGAKSPSQAAPGGKATPARGDRNANSLFRTTKEDKRLIRHSALISRIEKASTKSKKRRRPSKKLVTTLESLVDALPDVPPAADGETLDAARAKQRKLKSRPGALKRKAKLETLERERFAKNMAQMAVATTTHIVSKTPGDYQDPPDTHDTSRLGALRNFILGNLKP